jgi:hypothetical protein
MPKAFKGVAADTRVGVRRQSQADLLSPDPADWRHRDNQRNVDHFFPLVAQDRRFDIARRPRFIKRPVKTHILHTDNDSAIHAGRHAPQTVT